MGYRKRDDSYESEDKYKWNTVSFRTMKQKNITLSTTEAEFVNFLANHIAAIELDSYEREALNNIEGWAIALGDLASVANELLTVFKFSSEQVNENAIQQFSILSIEAGTEAGFEVRTVDVNEIVSTGGTKEFPARTRADPGRLAASGRSAERCAFETPGG